MDDVHIAYEEVNQLYLKDELESDDSPEDTRSCEPQTEKNVYHETRAKCGDIFVGCQGNFILVCSICKDEFETFDSFGLHTKENHLEIKSKQQVELLPTWHTRNIRTGKNRCKNENLPQAPWEPDVKISHVIDSSLAPEPSDEEPEAKKINVTLKLPEEERNKKFDASECTSEVKTGRKAKQVPPGKKGYFCTYCVRTFTSKRSFVTHSNKKHNYNPAEQSGGIEASVKPIVELVEKVCKYCDKCFDDQIELKNHVSTHTGRSRYVCPFCPKTFVTPFKRQLHINTHTGERPFKCTHCPKAFSRKTNLEMHTRTHLGIMKYSCDYCGKRFVQSAAKMHHERVHTGEKPYQCEECGKRFLAYAKLVEHSKRHKNIRPYKCEMCDKAFYNATLLKGHMRTHTGERPFQCDICCQTYSHRRYLDKHRKQHLTENK